MLDNTRGLAKSDPGRFYAIQRPAINPKRAAVDAYYNYIIGTGPFVYWPLKEKTGTAADDAIGTLDGTHTGLTLGQLKGNFVAPYYSGSGSYTDVYTAGLNTTWNRNEYTVNVWVWLDFLWSETVNRTAINIQSADNTDISYIQKTTAAGTLSFMAMHNSVSKTVTVGSLSFSGWGMLTIANSDSGNTMKAFINGAQVGTTQTGIGTSAAPALSTTACVIGRSTTGATKPWIGWIAHAALWNSALSDAAILALYNQGI